MFFKISWKISVFIFQIFIRKTKTVEKGVFHEKLFSRKTVFHAFPRTQTPPKCLILVCTSVNLVLAVYIWSLVKFSLVLGFWCNRLWTNLFLFFFPLFFFSFSSNHISPLFPPKTTLKHEAWSVKLRFPTIYLMKKKRSSPKRSLMKSWMINSWQW